MGATDRGDTVAHASTGSTPATTSAAIPPPGAALMGIIFGLRASHATAVAAQLGIADLLKDGPMPVAELARATDTHAPALYRLLRALAGIGIFAEDGDGRFTLTPLAEPLRADVPGSVRGYALLAGEEFFWRPWGDLRAALRTGEPAFDRVYGMPFFDYFAQHPEAAAVFNDAMTSNSGLEADAIVAAYDFAGMSTLVDVAGGHGALLAAVLRANPRMRGILFDLPPVVAGAGELLDAAGVADRCTTVGGDMFASVPEGGDAYTLKRILHDWDDEQAIAILRACHRAMPAHGRLLVMDQVIPPGNAPHPGKFYDLMMLVLLGGRERTAAEFEALFAAAGFALTGITPTASPVSIIAGRKVGT